MLTNRKVKIKLSIFLILIYAGAIGNVFVPVIRFENRLYNLWFTNCIMCLPFFLFALGSTYKHWYLKVMSTLLYGAIAFMSGIVIVFNIYAINHMTGDSFDSSFQVVSNYYYGESEVKVYRIQGGALTSYGIVIRHEKPLVKGVLLVKEIYKQTGKKAVNVQFRKSIVHINGDDVEIKDELFSNLKVFLVNTFFYR